MIRVVVLALSLLSCACGVAGDSASFTAVANKLGQITCTVRVSSASTANSAEVVVGSGVALEKGWVATTQFKFPGQAASESDYRLTWPGGEQAQAKARVIDEFTGLVLLETQTPELTKIPINDVPVVGSPVMVASGSGIERPVLSQGIISAVDRTIAGSKGALFIQSDAHSTPSSSGGPLMNEQGQLVGIVMTAEPAADQGVWTYAIPASQLARLRSEVVPNQTKVLDRAPVTAGLKLRSGETKGKVEVESVAVGGPAAKAGLSPGDVILEVDQRQVRNSLQVAERVQNRRSGDKVQIVVIPEHGGAKKLVELELAPQLARREIRDESSLGEEVAEGKTLPAVRQLVKQGIEEQLLDSRDASSVDESLSWNAAAEASSAEVSNVGRGQVLLKSAGQGVEVQRSNSGQPTQNQPFFARPPVAAPVQAQEGVTAATDKPAIENSTKVVPAPPQAANSVANEPTARPAPALARDAKAVGSFKPSSSEGARSDKDVPPASNDLAKLREELTEVKRLCDQLRQELVASQRASTQQQAEIEKLRAEIKRLAPRQ